MSDSRTLQETIAYRAKREQFALAIAGGMHASNFTSEKQEVVSIDTVSDWIVAAAESLIASLDKPERNV